MVTNDKVNHFWKDLWKCHQIILIPIPKFNEFHMENVQITCRIISPRKVRETYYLGYVNAEAGLRCKCICKYVHVTYLYICGLVNLCICIYSVGIWKSTGVKYHLLLCGLSTNTQNSQVYRLISHWIRKCLQNISGAKSLSIEFLY